MATPPTQQPADTNINDSSKSRRGATRQARGSLRGPTGPTTQLGKARSRSNATKHGIFAVGIVPKLESRAEYLRLLDDLTRDLVPVGRLEEILVEKLTMLVWRYRRLLRAEAVEITEVTEDFEEDQKALETSQFGLAFLKGTGLLPEVLAHGNKVALLSAVAKLEELRQCIRKEGLNWERDLSVLILLFGGEEKENKQGDTIMEPRATLLSQLISADELVSKYRELTINGPKSDSATQPQSDAAKPIVKLLDRMIDMYKPLVEYACKRSHDQYRLHVAKALVPN